MSQQLWFLRHGEAEPHGSAPDEERALTERGRGQSVAAGRALASLGITFQAAFTSPKLRALETARLACEHLEVEPLAHGPLREGFDRAEAMALLHAAGDDRRVLLVGHEPDLSQTVHDLTGARIDLKKGGVAGVRIEGGSAELVALLRPRELDRIAG
ncbi:MAG TPA: phosphoglycerate mutase family protein [Solirubrobacteraceae bacterium]|nr:phosphoglycerate mutase family protein [Solirubrobacteraceae bacterium]